MVFSKFQKHFKKKKTLKDGQDVHFSFLTTSVSNQRSYQKVMTI